MLSVSSAGKTNGLLRVDAFLVNTDLCWPTVGGRVEPKSYFEFDETIITVFKGVKASYWTLGGWVKKEIGING